jgi:hypothetical protein
VDAEPVGQGGVDLQDLAGLALLVLAVQVADVAHVVEPVGQLDDQHPDVAGHGDDHLADDLGLGRLPTLVADPVELAQPLGDLGHLGPELLADLLPRQQALLDGVVQQGGLHRHGVQAQVGHDRGHPQGVGQIGDARGPAAAGVAPAGQLEGAAHGGGVGPRVALADPLEQRLHGRLGRQPGVIGPGDRLGGGPVVAGHGGVGLGLAVERQPVGDRRRMLLRHRAWPHPGWSSVARRVVGGDQLATRLPRYSRRGQPGDARRRGPWPGRG